MKARASLYLIRPVHYFSTAKKSSPCSEGNLDAGTGATRLLTRLLAILSLLAIDLISKPVDECGGGLLLMLLVSRRRARTTRRRSFGAAVALDANNLLHIDLRVLLDGGEEDGARHRHQLVVDGDFVLLPEGAYVVEVGLARASHFQLLFQRFFFFLQAAITGLEGSLLGLGALGLLHELLPQKMHLK